ncbi:hypothetical protein Tco_1196441, partial [Tanacetum coccineum]
EDDEDPEEDPADYPTNRDDDEEEDESSREDVDDEEEDEDEEEEEEHLAPADSISPPACHTTARMSIRDQTPIPFPSAIEVDKFLSISTPPPSPLTSYSSPLPHIPSPPLPVSSPLPISPPPLPTSPTYPLGYRAAMIRLRAESPSTSYPLTLPSPIVFQYTRASMAMMRVAAPSTYILASRSETPPSGTPPLLPIPLLTPSPPLLLPSTNCRAGVSERDYGFVATLDDEIRRDRERDVGYGIKDTWDEMVEDMQGTPAVTDVAGLSQRMTDFVTDWIGVSMLAQLDLWRVRPDFLVRLRYSRWIPVIWHVLRTLQTQVKALQSQQGPARGPTHPDVPEEADQTPIPFPSAIEVDKFLAISTPLPSPLTSYSSPLPQIPSPPLPVSSPLPISPPPLPASPTYPLGYRDAMIRLRAESPSTSHPLPLPSPIVLPYTRAYVAMIRAAAPSTYILASRSETPPSRTPPLLPIPLLTPSPPFLLPSTNCRAGVSEVTLSPQKRLCITLGLRFEVGESSSAPTARPTLDDEIRQDTNEIYGKLDDAHDDRSLMRGQLNMMRRDRCAYARTARLIESEARLSREAWVQSMDSSDTSSSKVRTIVLAQQTEIKNLRAADRRRQSQPTEALTLLRTLQTQMVVP